MNKTLFGFVLVFVSHLSLVARAHAAEQPATTTPPGFTEAQVGVGWSVVDFAGASVHQRGGEGYGVNTGWSLMLAAQHHPRALRRLGIGASARISLTGATNDTSGRYFNPMSVGLMVTYAFLDPESGPFARLEGGMAGVTRKLRAENAQGLTAIHDFGIGWGAALGLGYRFRFGDAFRGDLLAAYERQSARVERTGQPSAQWSYGISSLTFAYVF